MSQKDAIQATNGLAEFSKEALTTTRSLATAMRDAALSSWLTAMKSNGHGAEFVETWVGSIRKAQDLWLDAWETQARFAIDGATGIFGNMPKR